MAIEKKIKLYVSDATGERKTAKYYRIPTVGDSLPYNTTTNPYKDLFRVYAKVVGDRIMFTVINKQSFLARYAAELDVFREAFNINLPQEFLNSGESTVTITAKGIDDGEVAKYSVTKGIITFTPNSQSFVDKETMFSQLNSIISDEYTDLVEVVPREWIEKDNINEILREVTTWRWEKEAFIPDAMTEDSVKEHSEFHEITPRFFSDNRANGSDYHQFYHEYNGGGHMGDTPENNIQGYSIPEGMLIGDELDMLITADPGADAFVCTINKDGSKHVRKCSFTNYEYYIDSYERGGYRIHLTGASNISKFIIAYNERNMLNAGFIYIKKNQFKLD